MIISGLASDVAVAAIASCKSSRLHIRFPFWLLLLVTVAGCSEDNSYVPPPAPKVVVEHPLQQPITQYIEVTGNTQAINTVDLEARVEGFLEEINYEDGTLAKKGDLLFGIQRNTYEAELAQAQANLAASQAAEANAKIQYGRQVTLGTDDSPSFSQAISDDAKTRFDEATANVETARANLELATINLGYTEVAAPFDGIVTRHLVDVGALVGEAGPTKLATIVQVDPIYVYFNISEPTVLHIKAQLEAQDKTLRDVHQLPVEIGLQTEDGYPHKGHIDYIAPQVDPSTGTLEVRGIFENTKLSLLPGLFVRVRVPVQQIDDALLVADTSVRTSQIGEYVLVVDDDNVVQQRSVTVGQLDGQLRVIQSGLNAGEWVVTEGLQRAIPGSKVEPEQKNAVASKGGDPAKQEKSDGTQQATSNADHGK